MFSHLALLETFKYYVAIILLPSIAVREGKRLSPFKVGERSGILSKKRSLPDLTMQGRLCFKGWQEV